MIKGMFTEHKEVFVTAFVDGTTVRKVTATVGSKHQCRCSDNANNWGVEAARLGTATIRQYHNHVEGLLRSFPSPVDIEAHRQVKRFLEEMGVVYRSFLVYRSLLGFAKMKEYH